MRLIILKFYTCSQNGYSKNDHRFWGSKKLEIVSIRCQINIFIWWVEERCFFRITKRLWKKESEQLVNNLQKALYGLKRAPVAWFSRIESYFIEEGFKRISSEQTLFVKKKGGKIRIMTIYVDDFLFTGDDEEILGELKYSMKREFDMTDLGQ